MGSGSIAPSFLALAFAGGEWSASRPGRFTPGERAKSTHWIGGWLDYSSLFIYHSRSCLQYGRSCQHNCQEASILSAKRIASPGFNCYLIIYTSFVTSYLSNYSSTALCWTLGAFSVSSSFTQSVEHLGRGISPSQGRYLHIGKHRNRKTHIQTYMSSVEFEPTIPVFKLTKTVHALDRATTVIDITSDHINEQSLNITFSLERELN
jgi:hypothetical protein